MKPTVLSIVLVLVLLASAVSGLGFVLTARAASDGSIPQLSMPMEHINYTITEINDTLWAKIDGSYPISQLNQPGCSVLPMVYPMPPNAANIHVILDGKELEWTNYTQAFPGEVHKTAIGEWGMISCLLENLSDSFLLEIHYMHPLERVNGSFLFLYDLNIRDYLSMESPGSIAYFTIRFDSNITGVHAYTALPGSVQSQWKPAAYTTADEDAARTVKVEMHSTYNTDLPGDLIIVLSSAPLNAVNIEEPSWLIPVTIDIVFVGIILYVKRKAVASAFSSRKTTN